MIKIILLFLWLSSPFFLPLCLFSASTSFLSPHFSSLRNFKSTSNILLFTLSPSLPSSFTFTFSMPSSLFYSISFSSSFSSLTFFLLFYTSFPLFYSLFLFPPFLSSHTYTHTSRRLWLPIQSANATYPPSKVMVAVDNIRKNLRKFGQFSFYLKLTKKSYFVQKS